SLPLAMSEDQDLRQDAQENMRDFAPELPFGIQEEQLEGLSGLMGAEEAQNRMIPKPAAPEIAPEAPQEVFNIPQDAQGKMVQPIDAIRMMVEKDPSLMASLPQETRDLLNPPQKGIDPLQTIRDLIKKDPTLMEVLPPEIKDKLQMGEPVPETP